MWQSHKETSECLCQKREKVGGRGRRQGEALVCEIDVSASVVGHQLRVIEWRGRETEQGCLRPGIDKERHDMRIFENSRFFASRFYFEQWQQTKNKLYKIHELAR